MDVGGRVECRRRGPSTALGGRSSSFGLDVRRPVRHGVDAADRDARAVVEATAAQTMQVPSRPIVTDAKPSRRLGGIVILAQELAGRDCGHVDAEEELLGRHRPLAVGAPRSSSRRRARPSAAVGGSSGRWRRCCRRSSRGCGPGRRRSARRPRRESAGREPRRSRRSRCRSSSHRSRARRRAATRRPSARSRPFRSTSASGEAARAFITLTSVWPPASARAPSLSASSRERLGDRRRPRISDLARSMQVRF